VVKHSSVGKKIQLHVVGIVDMCSHSEISTSGLGLDSRPRGSGLDLMASALALMFWPRLTSLKELLGHAT